MIGALHRNGPHDIDSVPRPAPAESIAMVNRSTGAASVSDRIGARPRSCAGP